MPQLDAVAVNQLSSSFARVFIVDAKKVYHGDDVAIGSHYISTVMFHCLEMNCVLKALQHYFSKSRRTSQARLHRRIGHGKLQCYRPGDEEDDPILQIANEGNSARDHSPCHTFATLVAMQS